MYSKKYVENRMSMLNRMLNRPKLFSLEKSDIKHYEAELKTLRKIDLELKGKEYASTRPNVSCPNNRFVWSVDAGDILPAVQGLKKRAEFIYNKECKTELEELEYHFIDYCLTKFEKGGIYGFYCPTY